MMDVDDLESAINSAKDSSMPAAEKSPKDDSGEPDAEVAKMSKEEEIGFHKGALNTLVAERGELVKMIGNVEAIMQAHISRLKELGVDIK